MFYKSQTQLTNQWTKNIILDRTPSRLILSIFLLVYLAIASSILAPLEYFAFLELSEHIILFGASLIAVILSFRCSEVV